MYAISSSPGSVRVSDGDDADDGTNGILLLNEDGIDPVDEDDTYDSEDGDVDDEIQPLMVEKQDNSTDDEGPKSPFMPAGDSLRGIGVTLVILYHMGYDQFKNAWFVISLFFSLSGFIMTKNTVEQFERRGQVDVLRFWAKRISRLFPALLLTLNIILLSQKLRKNDGATFQREGEDIWYATIFMTNYNLAYNQVDDYFSEFMAPSITRHLWTLSIEEQYYIIWPLVLFIITTTGAWMSENNENYDKIGQGIANDPYTISGTSKVCVRAILMLDIFVMALSYVSSTITLENYGTSQAYYSTMCRMGDIAAGGFTYSFVRLNPYLSRRWYRDPTLPPMTLKMRIILELMGLILIILLVSVPMIQTPVDEMLAIYFKWFRLFISLMLSGVVANTIQLSEPLPRWAIVSKIVTFKPLIIVGVISYGVYVFHWPLLVYFGDPRGMGKKKVELGWEDPYEGVLGYEGRNVVLFLLVMAVGYFSFFCFELPCLTLSRASMPQKTIFTGFLSLGITLIINWLITKDLPAVATFENDVEAFSESIDSRFTPIFFSSAKWDMQSSLFLDVLDYRTRSSYLKRKQIEEMEHFYDGIIQAYSNEEFSASDVFVIIMCKDLAEQSPCDDPNRWNDNTYWVWLNSSDLCGEETESNQVKYQERCENVVPISELTLGEMENGELAMYSMIIGVDDAFPGVINQNTVSRLETDYERLMNGGNKEDYLSGEEWDPMRITVLGESVGERLGMFWKDTVSMDMPNLENDPFPAIAVTNMANGGYPAIAYFACLSTHPKYQYDECHQFESDLPSIVLGSFESNRPNVVVVKDSHLFKDDGQFGEETLKMGLETFFEKIMALNIMMNEAKKSGVEHLFYTTLSRTELKFEILSHQYFKEMNIIMQMVDILGCPKGDPSGMWMTVFDWAKLVCPDIEKERCVQNQHGFDLILPDKIHPSGDSGLWLSREALGLIVAEVARYSLPDKFGLYSSWDEAIENPITKKMLKLAPPDGDPFLKDIVSRYYLCPYKDLEALEEDYNQASFPNFPSPENRVYNYTSYKDSVHYNVFDSDKDSDHVELDGIFNGDSNEELNWYSNSEEVEKRYGNRVVLRGPDPSQEGNSAVIDWAVNKTHIRLAVAAPATGYVGFGLADEGGGFLGADMVFLESGNPESLRDTYTTDEEKPQTDDCACDWKLLSSKIAPNAIGFEAVRLLDTGDAQDRKITNDSNELASAHNVIVAWGDSKTVDSIEENRGRGSVRFFQEEASEPFHSIMERGAEDSFAVQAHNYQVPDKETNYLITCLTKEDMIVRGLPKTDEKMHLVGFEPIIQSKNSDHVHHYLLYGYPSDHCDGDFQELIWVWGNGLGALALPDFLGLPFNGEHEFNSFRLHIHYHNPLLRSDIIDSSGVRLYWTSKVRQEEMGLFILGDPWMKTKFSPLGKGLSQHDFKCPSSCTESSLDQPITVLQEVHHAHRLGKQMVIDHFRNGKKIRSGKVEYFDWYTIGNVRVMQEPFTVERGDSFTMSCYYEDEDGLKSVFGVGANDEMCMGGFLYYPRVKKDSWNCGYKVQDSECSGSYKRTKIPDIKALGRSFPFGDKGEGCPSYL